MIQAKQNMTTPMLGIDSNELLLSVSFIDCPVLTAVA